MQLMVGLGIGLHAFVLLRNVDWGCCGDDYT